MPRRFLGFSRFIHIHNWLILSVTPGLALFKLSSRTGHSTFQVLYAGEGESRKPDENSTHPALSEQAEKDKVATIVMKVLLLKHIDDNIQSPTPLFTRATSLSRSVSTCPHPAKRAQNLSGRLSGPRLLLNAEVSIVLLCSISYLGLKAIYPLIYHKSADNV